MTNHNTYGNTKTPQECFNLVLKHHDYVGDVEKPRPKGQVLTNSFKRYRNTTSHSSLETEKIPLLVEKTNMRHISAKVAWHHTTFRICSPGKKTDEKNRNPR